jgi:DNA transformation protein and related proteins
MDAEGLKDLFEPFGPVSVKRMFSGHGIYAGGLFFALEIGGEIYLKSGAESAAALAAAGSAPFAYRGRGRLVTTSLWRLVASAYDDPDEFRRWCALALEAARAKALEASRKKAKRAPGGRGARPSPPRR